MKLILIIALFVAPAFAFGQDVLRPADYYKKLKEEGKDVQLVDVRTPEEYKEGHIKDFININFNGTDFQKDIMALDKSKAVFLYCRSGNRSQQTQRVLKKMGFTTVIDLHGGFEAWKGGGFPVKKD